MNGLDEARVVDVEQLVHERGVVLAGFASDGDADDTVLFDVLMTAGTDGLPVDLKLSLPAPYITGRHGLQCIGWIARQVHTASDESISVLTDWFTASPPVTKSCMLGAALVEHDRAVETIMITTTDGAPTDRTYRVSLNKLCCQIPEAVRQLILFQSLFEQLL